MIIGLGTLLGPASGIAILTLLLLAAPLAWPLAAATVRAAARSGELASRASRGRA